MVHGGMSIIKYLTFFFNFLFVLFGLVFIIIGSLALSGTKEFTKIGEKLHAPIILLIVLGCFILLLSFLGCCGAIKENYCMLMTFSVILFLLFVIELAAGISAYIFRNNIEENAKELFFKEMDKYKNGGEDQKFWDNLQTDAKCCGVYNYTDWKSVYNSTELPRSCCKNNTTVCDSSMGDFYTQGCFESIKDKLMKYSWQIMVAALVIAFLQLLGMIFGCCLARTIKKEYETV